MTQGNSGFIGPIIKQDKTEFAGKFDLFDQYNSKLADTWPDPISIQLVESTTGTGTNGVNTIMGTTHTYQANSTGFDHNAETIYWDVNIPSESPWSLDYFASTSGSFTMGTDNTGTFTMQIYQVPSRDMGFNGEGDQTYYFNFYRGSVGGTLIGTSSNFIVPDYFVTEARFANGGTSYNEGQVNGYWQFRGDNASNMTVLVNYTSGYLMPGLGGGQTTNGNSRMVLIDGLGTSNNKYRLRNTSSIDGSVTEGNAYFKYNGGGSTLNYTLALNSAATSQDYIRVWWDEGAGYTSSSATLYGNGTSTVTYNNTRSLPHDTSIRVQLVNNSGATGIQCFGTELWMSSFVNASDAVLTSEITNEETSFTATSGSTTTDYFNVDTDLTTEGTETLFAWWYAGLATASGTKYYVLGWDDILINDTSTTPNVTVTPNVSSVNEGNSVVFTITDANSSQTGTLYYTVTGTNVTSSDFDAGFSGSFSMSNGSGSVTCTLAIGDGTESNESFQLQVRTGSTSGTIIATSSSVTIVDAVPDLTNSVVSIPSINVIYTGTSADYTGAFDVLDVTVPSGYSGTARIFMGLRVTASTTFYNDICIGGVQVLNSSGTTLLDDYIFYGSTGGTGSGWVTLNGQYVDSTTRANLSSGATYGISTSTNTGRWSWATSTGSSTTGAADGISSAYATTILPSPGNGVVSQTSNAYYAYRETSGSTRYTTAWAKSPSRTWSGGEIIRICYHFSTNSGQNGIVDPNDSIRITLI